MDELIEECLRQSRILEAQYAQYARHTPQEPEPFRLLGAPYPCSPEQLRARWRELAFRHHPDRGGDLKKFIELKAAYEEAARTLDGGPTIILRYRG